MKTVFINPFDSIELSEKVDGVVLKIGCFDYTFLRAKVSSTEIDFDERNIKINDSLDSTAILRETIRAFFIIVAYELKLNDKFSNGKDADLNDMSVANLSWHFMHWFDESTFDWNSDEPYPIMFKVGAVSYSVREMYDVSLQTTQSVQYGISDHVLNRVAIIDKIYGIPIKDDMKTLVFWHEYVHCLFVISNETYANDIEYVVDAFATQIMLFMNQFKKIVN